MPPVKLPWQNTSDIVAIPRPGPDLAPQGTQQPRLPWAPGSIFSTIADSGIVPDQFVPLVDYLYARRVGQLDPAIYAYALIDALLSQYPGLWAFAGVHDHANPAHSYLLQARGLGLILDSLVYGAVAVWLSPNVSAHIARVVTQANIQSTGAQSKSTTSLNVAVAKTTRAQGRQSTWAGVGSSGSHLSRIPRHFDVLIELLNELLPSGAPPKRAKVKDLLLARQGNVFELAGVAGVNKPIKSYLAQARKLGIVRSAKKGRVALEEKYYSWKRQ